jgi:Protein of unknown function (DUF2398)
LVRSRTSPHRSGVHGFAAAHHRSLRRRSRRVSRYKDHLVDYLERFIKDLVTVGGEIAALLGELGEGGQLDGDAEAFPARIAELLADSLLETEDLRNRALRHHLTRRLLDDPVLYYHELTAYLAGQRPALTRRICELTGLVAEVRAEGIAMVDPHDDLTDVRMPDTGTDGHLTVLLAEHLARSAEGIDRAAVPEVELRFLAS